MKTFLKAIARQGWRFTGPIRRPISRKLQASTARVVGEKVREELQPRFDILLQVMNVARQEAHASRVDTNLVLDSLVRELARMQYQIESLQDQLSEATRAKESLGFVSLERGSNAA